MNGFFLEKCHIDIYLKIIMGKDTYKLGGIITLSMT